MTMRRKLVVSAAALVAAALIAQEGGELTIRQRVDEVIAPTTVLDKDGVYVTGLKPMEFRLYDNDKPQTIKVDEVISPVSLVVAIQADYKVEKPFCRRFRRSEQCCRPWSPEMAEKSQSSAFDHQLQMLQDFTSDPDKITEGLKKLKPGSSQSVLTDASTKRRGCWRNVRKNAAAYCC